MARWKEAPPPDRAWKRKTGASPGQEQDKAAGGRSSRLVNLGEGRTALASVALKLYPKTRRLRAVLRWSQDGRSPERYLGEVEHDTRSANLAEGWQRARAAGLLAECESAHSRSWASSPQVRATMRGNRSKDTTPELALRSLLHQRGLRYRVDAYPVPGLRRRADILFPRERLAVFVDGCFWHGCPEHYRPSTKNTPFWQDKLRSNRARDSDTNQALAAAGWAVIRIWEHEDMTAAADRVETAVRTARERSSERTAMSARRNQTDNPAASGHQRAPIGGSACHDRQDPHTRP
jgi:DNA mismatch endonuclease (patch repair protein)